MADKTAARFDLLRPHRDVRDLVEEWLATAMLRLKIVVPKRSKIGKASPSYHRDLGPPVVLAHQEAVVGLTAAVSVHIYRTKFRH